MATRKTTSRPTPDAKRSGVKSLTRPAAKSPAKPQAKAPPKPRPAVGRKPAATPPKAGPGPKARATSATRSPAKANAAANASARPQEQPEVAAAVRVLRQFRLVFNSVKTHFQQLEKRAGLGGAQVWALSIVRDRPGIGVNELARAMDVRQPTASNLVKALLDQDLIELTRHEHDRRAVMLRVRPAGTRLLRRVPGPFTGVLPEALAALDPATLKRLEQDLTALIKVLDADERGASIPLSQM